MLPEATVLIKFFHFSNGYRPLLNDYTTRGIMGYS